MKRISAEDLDKAIVGMEKNIERAKKYELPDYFSWTWYFIRDVLSRDRTLEMWDSVDLFIKLSDLAWRGRNSWENDNTGYWGDFKRLAPDANSSIYLMGRFREVYLKLMKVEEEILAFLKKMRQEL